MSQKWPENVYREQPYHCPWTLWTHLRRAIRCTERLSNIVINIRNKGRDIYVILRKTLIVVPFGILLVAEDVRKTVGMAGFQIKNIISSRVLHGNPS